MMLLFFFFSFMIDERQVDNDQMIYYCRIMETAPTLPDFALALKPDEYQLPPVDPSWNEEKINGGQTGSNQLKGAGDR
jgi:hypothetical protein